MGSEVVRSDGLVKILGGRVVKDDAIFVNHQTPGRSITIVAVGNDVGDGLAEDPLAQTDTDISLKIEGVV